MDRLEKQALERILLAMGDDELILGHRNSEWCGYAPFVEEDIAFANFALDEIGHASAWYTILSDLAGQDPQTHPDRLVFFRDASEFRNVRMVELPKGDWAFSMLRQFFFDSYEMVRLRELERSLYPPLAAAAAKIRKEELYHYRHTSAWVKRLGQGTEESHSRMQKAVFDLWPFTRQLFAPIEGEATLVAAGFVPASAAIQSAWFELVSPLLREAGLELEQSSTQDREPDGHAGGRDQHTAHLQLLVAELQSVARLEPEAGW